MILNREIDVFSFLNLWSGLTGSLVEWTDHPVTGLHTIGKMNFEL